MDVVPRQKILTNTQFKYREPWLQAMKSMRKQSEFVVHKKNSVCNNFTQWSYFYSAIIVALGSEFERVDNMGPAVAANGYLQNSVHGLPTFTSLYKITEPNTFPHVSGIFKDALSSGSGDRSSILLVLFPFVAST
jgi:hypothetical protein